MPQAITKGINAAEPDSFGFRLREALDQSSHRSLRGLAKEMHNYGLLGTRDWTLGTFLRNQKEPRRDVLEVLAKVLKVRAAWLAFGDGPMLNDAKNS